MRYLLCCALTLLAACGVADVETLPDCTYQYRCDDTRHTNDDGCHGLRAMCLHDLAVVSNDFGTADLWLDIAQCLQKADPGDVRYCYTRN